LDEGEQRPEPMKRRTYQGRLLHRLLLPYTDQAIRVHRRWTSDTKISEFFRFNTTADRNKLWLLRCRAIIMLGGSPVEDPPTSTASSSSTTPSHLLLPARRRMTTDCVRRTTCIHIGFAAPDKKLSFLLPPRFNYLFTFAILEYSEIVPLQYYNKYSRHSGLRHYIVTANTLDYSILSSSVDLSFSGYQWFLLIQYYPTHFRVSGFIFYGYYWIHFLRVNEFIWIHLYGHYWFLLIQYYPTHFQVSGFIFYGYYLIHFLRVNEFIRIHLYGYYWFTLIQYYPMRLRVNGFIFYGHY
jgi:hypothetical protein